MKWPIGYRKRALRWKERRDRNHYEAQSAANKGQSAPEPDLQDDQFYVWQYTQRRSFVDEVEEEKCLAG